MQIDELAQRVFHPGGKPRINFPLGQPGNIETPKRETPNSKSNLSLVFVCSFTVKKIPWLHGIGRLAHGIINFFTRAEVPFITPPAVGRTGWPVATTVLYCAVEAERRLNEAETRVQSVLLGAIETGREKEREREREREREQAACACCCGLLAGKNHPKYLA